MSEQRMFGTPPEPLFNHRLSGVTSEMLQEWIATLIEENTRALKSVQSSVGSSMALDTIQCVFLVCERLKMSNEVKYLAIELFDRFINKHVEDLHSLIQNTYSLKTRAREWRETKKRVGSQVILRILTCIQIACKLTSHYRILSPRRVRLFLQETGHRYSLESIFQSELRVLRTLNFKVSRPSVLVYMESFLEILGRREPDLEVKVLYGVAQSLLDMVYLRYDQVYDMLHRVASGDSPSTYIYNKDSFAVVRADKMLLISAIITTATYMLDVCNHQQVMQALSKLTSIPTVDIADFTSVILQLVISESNF